MVVIKMDTVFGRTNRTVPSVWLRPLVGHNHEQLVESWADTPVIIDGGSNPALWGQLIRQQKSTEVMSIAGRDIERASSDHQAADFIGAHLIETLSSLQRTYLSFCFLSVRRALEEHQINGALQSLHSAKEEGLVQHIGLHIAGPTLAATSLWRFHDAFECVLARCTPNSNSDFTSVLSLAKEKRVGVIAETDLESVHLSRENPVLIGVRTPQEVKAALGGLAVP